MTIVRASILGLLLCLGCQSAQAKSHLSRDELKIISATSVAVVYVDSDTPLHPYIKNNGAAGGGGFAGAIISGMIADAVAQHQMTEFDQRVAPYQSVIAGLDLSQRTHQAVQDALASVPALQQMPWIVAIPDPKNSTFMKDQALKTKAQIVIFIRPLLMMNDDADDLYMTTVIDIETLDATGKSFNHYDSSILSFDVDMDSSQLPPAASTKPGMEDEDIQAMRLFSNAGAPFQPFYAKLLQQTQQKLYYFFTGNDTAPPAATHAGP